MQPRKANYTADSIPANMGREQKACIYGKIKMHIQADKTVELEKEEANEKTT